jgi:hypothetical protein
MYTANDLTKINVLIDAQAKQIDAAIERTYDALSALMMGGDDINHLRGMYDACERTIVCLQNTMDMYHRRYEAIFADVQPANDDDEIDPKGKDFWGHYGRMKQTVRSMGIDDEAWHESMRPKYRVRSVRQTTNQQRLNELRKAECILALYESAEMVREGAGIIILMACAKARGCELHELHGLPASYFYKVQQRLDEELINTAHRRIA